jgi:hypothetical protein
MPKVHQLDRLVDEEKFGVRELSRLRPGWSVSHMAQVRIMRGLDPPGAVIVGLAMQEALTVNNTTAPGMGQCLRPAGASSGRVQRADRLHPNKVISVNRSHSSLAKAQRNTGPFYGRRCPDLSDSAVKCG